MQRSRIAGAVVAGFAALVLAGCGSAAPKAPADPPTVGMSSPSAAPTTTETTAEATAEATTEAPTTPTTTPPSTPHTKAPTARTHTAPATTAATHHATTAPIRRTTPPGPATTRASVTKVCSIRSNAGNCYRAGQFCRNGDLGRTTTDAAGRRITCVMQSGRPHWHY